MYLFENPVLQRELLVNLRMKRAFVLLLVYQAALAMVVLIAWPRKVRLTANAADAQELVNLFFLGQYLLASLMAPSFAALTITGEKERKTYELLLATPLRPAAITFGKILASLTHLALLIFASLPIVMLCLPLGGVSLYEVLAAYGGLILSVIVFGMISVACSSYFERSAAALVASYLLILPLAFAGIVVWTSFSGGTRLALITFFLPIIASAIVIPLFRNTSQRLLHPPDVGSEGKEVVDLEQENAEVIGLVINRDDFPDRLFAPPKRTDLLEDGMNPVYDKEIHSEIFSQGTLMLRVVIQVSMFLAVPIMAFCLFFQPWHSPWFVSYVVLFNMLVGPVFSAGSITSERERQTLDLLLTTTITPWQILWGKLLAGLRVSSVLTMFLLWPLLLACLMVSYFWMNFGTSLAFFTIVFITCAMTATIALCCSVVFRKTSMALMTSYLVVVLLFCFPVALSFLASRYIDTGDGAAIAIARWLGALSPFVAAFSLPLSTEVGSPARWTQAAPLFPDNVGQFWLYIVASLTMLSLLMGAMIWLFHRRWRVAQ